MSQPTQFVPLEPPADWRDRLDWEFSAFYFHLQEDHCRSCGAVFHWSQVYTAFTRKVSAAPTSPRRLCPTAQVVDGLPLVVQKLPPREVPVCHHCVSGDREASVTLLVSSDAEWNEALRRDREAREAARRSAGRSSAPALSLNEIPG